MGKSAEKELWTRAKRMKMNRVAASVIGVALGVILLLWPESSLEVLSQLVGLALAIGGVIAVVLYFVNHDGLMLSTLQLIFGVILAAIGVWIFLRPAGLVALIPTIIGLIIVINGVADLGQTITLSRQKYGKWWLSLIFAVLTIVFGLVLIIKPFGIAAFITRVIGVVLIFNGVSDLWMVSKISNEIRGMKQEMDARDVTATVVDEGPARGWGKKTAQDKNGAAGQYRYGEGVSPNPADGAGSEPYTGTTPQDGRQ